MVEERVFALSTDAIACTRAARRDCFRSRCRRKSREGHSGDTARQTGDIFASTVVATVAMVTPMLQALERIRPSDLSPQIPHLFERGREESNCAVQ